VNRLAAVALLVAGTAAGCGSSGSSSTPPSKNGTIDALLRRPGPDVSVTPGADAFVVGSVRYPFLVIANNGKPVEKKAARVWVATGRKATPFAAVTAPLEPIGIPGKSGPAAGGVTKIYVAQFPIFHPGRYWLVAEPEGARLQAVGVFSVKAVSQVPAIGEKAPRSKTPTLGSAPVTALTTARPPDRDLLRYSVAGSLAAHKPFVVTFATPKFCTSRVCGPVVDVVDAARQRFAARGIRFIHVEVFTGNNPTKGYNRWMKQWRLTSEPWTFLAGADGVIKAEFQGSVSLGELSASIRRYLVS
jgi:hypothetical protein